MNRLATYLRQSQSELSKITWPSRRKAAQLTVAVIAFSLVIAVFIGIIDYGFTKAIERIILKG